jgi:ketosteroid isomerase-like protein
VNHEPIDVVSRLFQDIRSGTAPADLAKFLDEQPDWFIPGDVNHVPWIGRKVGRAGFQEFYRQLSEYIRSEKFEISDILVKANRVVVLGYLESRVKATDKLIASEFCFDILVQNGLVTRYHMFEDTFAVASAVSF